MEKQNILIHAEQIWKLADTLRSVGIVDGDVPKSMMPFFALMMVDSRIIREVNKKRESLESKGYNKEDIIEELEEDMDYYNTSIIKECINIKNIVENDTNFYQNIDAYIRSFDPETRKLLGYSDDENELEYLNLKNEMQKLKTKNILYSIIKKWAEIPFEKYDNSEVTTLEENIKRRWADISAGQHYTPADIIDLIQKICLRQLSNRKNFTADTISFYDPTCGGGNMLFGCEDRTRTAFPHLKIKTRGQEFSDPLYALAKIEGRVRVNSVIKYGNTLTTDMFEGEYFDFIVANPPYGYSWKDYANEVRERGENTGDLLSKYPSESDGQLLFMQHIVAKMKDDGFAVVVTNGSPLFAEAAESGESEVRKWLLENNYLEALIRLPNNEFYNTGITTYLWILNKKSDKNKLRLIDASSEMFFTKMTKSKVYKRVEINSTQQDMICDLLFNDIADINQDFVKEFDKDFFFYNDQKIELIDCDVNGNVFDSKTKNGKLKLDVENIILPKGEALSAEDEALTDLKEKAKALNALYTANNEKIIVKAKDGEYSFNDERQTIVKTVDGVSTDLGCGVIKVKAAYKKATVKADEYILTTVELTTKTEKDNEIIEYSSDPAQNEELIKSFLDKWVERDYVMLDNKVGVEINFNKIFYKPEVLRPIDDIKADLEASNAILVGLMGDIFND
jgi:type I restriction enzyme M protein